MKGFLQFITEDIEIMANPPRSWNLGPSPVKFDDYIGKWFASPKLIGKWQGFELWETTKNRGIEDVKYFIIKELSTDNVAGLIDAEYYPKRSMSEPRLQISKTELHRDFQGRGSNIVTTAYKLIANKYNLQSSTLQSAGGASLWRRLLADPELRGRIYIRDRAGSLTPVDAKTKEEQIWAMSSEFVPPTAKSLPKFSRETKRNTKRVEPIYTLSLYIKKL
jgi:hypothetical protein